MTAKKKVQTEYFKWKYGLDEAEGMDTLASDF